MPPPFFIVGPTSSGKTLLAAEAAARLSGEIISADAFQVYRGLDILSAKPPRELRAAIPHHLVDVVPVSQEFDVAQYLSAAKLAIDGVTARGKLPIVVGGTGLYVRALTHGLADLPAGDPALRQQLEQLDLDTLRQRIADLDPDCAARIDLKNKRRLVRALEVCIVTGTPFSAHLRESVPAISPAGVLLAWDRGDLHIRIHDRVETMFNQGVVEEVRGLRSEMPGRTARQAIGWNQIVRFLNHEVSLEACKEEIKSATRKYAKRQLTWFRRQASFEQINLSSQPSSFEQAVELVVRRAASSFVPADV